MKDAEGNILCVGDEVIFVYNLWRGRDIACRGAIKSLSEQSALITITVKPEEAKKSWRDQKERRAKYTKIIKTNP